MSSMDEGDFRSSMDIDGVDDKLGAALGLSLGVDGNIEEKPGAA